MSGKVHVLKPRVPDVFPGSWAVGARPASMMSAPPVWATTTEVPPMPDDDTDEKTLQHAMNNLLPAPSNSFTNGFKGFFALDMWSNTRLWKAGAVEGAASLAFTFLTGSVGVTVSSYPPAAVGPVIFFANTIIVSLFIFGLSTATGAHINPLITLSTTITGLCHPVRAMIYIICQAIGSCLGGSFLRAGIGHERALATHNGGCFLDPDGVMSVGMAVCIEFAAAFALLFVSYGVGLDPTQKELYGAALGPLLVGALVGIITASTSGLNPGYTGAGIFPGRCFGLQVGVGQFYGHDWVWYIPDFAAAILHGIVYHFAPPYTRECPLSSTSCARGGGDDTVSVNHNSDALSLDEEGVVTLEARV
ncbi:hypothetical protein FRC12_016494 [Ceratobasidium sp. 428]|nr:hypothetical protein FRC12_016494 [Ceratobasidium sp. 428]